MPRYEGACHCATVRFVVTAQIAELTTCDCTLCVKKNALMAKVHETELTLTEGEAALGLYEWNTGRAKHYFCRRCGIYTFHRKRAEPDHFGVNIFCLEGVDAAALPVRATAGLDMGVVDPRYPGPREG